MATASNNLNTQTESLEIEELERKQVQLKNWKTQTESLEIAELERKQVQLKLSVILKPGCCLISYNIELFTTPHQGFWLVLNLFRYKVSALPQQFCQVLE